LDRLGLSLMNLEGRIDRAHAKPRFLWSLDVAVAAGRGRMKEGRKEERKEVDEPRRDAWKMAAGHATVAAH
jgi:hypothetical protein